MAAHLTSIFKDGPAPVLGIAGSAPERTGVYPARGSGYKEEGTVTAPSCGKEVDL
ncbi:MAG: hypothetical protein IMW93_02940 [Thermoanaerobacteraceae bacterium]|nr:hypothetical protein [Thermoanaerobacteraceae bacterium]